MRTVALIVVFFLAIPTPSSADTLRSIDCYDDTFCIESVRSGDQVNLLVSKLVPWHFTLQVNLQLQNMIADRGLPLIRTFSSEGKEPIMTLKISEPNRKWGYRFDLKWVVGALEAKHNDNYVYSLPYARNESFMVSQSYHGMASHDGKNAIDWDMPTGSRVRAAREGIVVEIEESKYRGGMDPVLKTQANYVRIQHPDGTIGNYVHLMPNGVRVSVGDRVRRGDLIAYSGDTGYSSGPHLHFEVFTISGSLQHRTIPVVFRANGRNGAKLLEGVTYAH